MVLLLSLKSRRVDIINTIVGRTAVASIVGGNAGVA